MSVASPPTPYEGRRRLVVAVLGLAAALLAWRAVDLVLTHGDFLRGQGEARTLRVTSIPAHRGVILDRRGEPLAASTPVDSVWANPQHLAAERSRWPELARTLDLPVKAIESALAGRLDREFVYVRRHVDPDVAARVMALGVAGVAVEREYRRYYPTGEVAAHLVGFTNVDDQGQEGIELAYDDWLRGEPGAKRVLRDRLGRTVEDVESIRSPHPGRDLYLSLDRRVQYLAYRELKASVHEHRARAGTVVVLDARTGEVLALANQPSYNPNNTSERVSARFRNRGLTDLFEPGSTMKPFTVAAGLEGGYIRPSSTFDTSPGVLRIGRYTVRDVHDYGTVDVARLLQKSSNVGAGKIALGMPAEALWQTLSALGFGTLTGSLFPGESAGILTDYHRWGEVHRVTLSYGYGLSATAMQLARAYQALARDGTLTSVSLVRLDAAPAESRAFSAATARLVRSMLEGVVGVGGTGTRAAVAGYRVAGKTGTVRKSGVGGYTADRYLSLFAGLAPASQPRLVVVALVDEPGGKDYYGGAVAGPLFSKVMAGALRLLGVPPDETSALADRVALVSSPVEEGVP